MHVVSDDGYILKYIQYLAFKSKYNFGHWSKMDFYFFHDNIIKGVDKNCAQFYKIIK